MHRPTVNESIDAATFAELQRLAQSRPSSGRQAAAKASAIRTLERMTRNRADVPPMPAPDWHPQAGTPWEELDRVFLEEHPEVRQRMWEHWRG